MGILSWAVYDGIEGSRPLASLDHFHRGKSTDISYIIILYRAVFLASWAPELCRTCHDSLMHVLKGGIRKTLLTPHFSGVWLFLCTFLWRSSKNWMNSTQQLMNFCLKAAIFKHVPLISSEMDPFGNSVDKFWGEQANSRPSSFMTLLPLPPLRARPILTNRAAGGLTGSCCWGLSALGFGTLKILEMDDSTSQNCNS
jgi:hypothetical protein